MWAATRTVRVGPWHVGVRASRTEADDAIVDMLGDRIVDDPDAPANFSLRIGGFGDDAPDPLHLLYRAKRAAVRSRRPSRILRALAATLSAMDLEPEVPLGRVDALVLVDETGRALVAGGALARQRTQLQPMLERSGIRVVDAPDPVVDFADGTLVIPTPTFSVDPARADALDARFGTEDADAPVAPGRYRLVGWAVDGAPASDAATIGTLLEDFAAPGADRAQALLDTVAEWAPGVRVETIPLLGRGPTAEALTALLAG